MGHLLKSFLLASLQLVAAGCFEAPVGRPLYPQLPHDETAEPETNSAPLRVTELQVYFVDGPPASRNVFPRSSSVRLRWNIELGAGGTIPLNSTLRAYFLNGNQQSGEIEYTPMMEVELDVFSLQNDVPVLQPLSSGYYVIKFVLETPEERFSLAPDVDFYNLSDGSRCNGQLGRSCVPDVMRVIRL